MAGGRGAGCPGPEAFGLFIEVDWAILFIEVDWVPDAKGMAPRTFAPQTPLHCVTPDGEHLLRVPHDTMVDGQAVTVR
jgi:hypothetical protein